MSAFATHAAAGALFGLVGALLQHAYWPRPAGGPDTGPHWMPGVVIVVWCALAGLFADLELAVGGHRKALTNVWVLLFLPAFVSTLLAFTAFGRHAVLRGLLPVLPAAMGSHLILDTFGWTSRKASLFWPLTDTVYVPLAPGRPHAYAGVGGWDAGFPIFFFLLIMIGYAWVWTLVVRRHAASDLGDVRVWVGAVAAALAVVVPVLLLRAVGALVPA